MPVVGLPDDWSAVLAQTQNAGCARAAYAKLVEQEETGNSWPASMHSLRKPLFPRTAPIPDTPAAAVAYGACEGICPDNFRLADFGTGAQVVDRF